MRFTLHRRQIAFFLAVILLVGMLPATVFAASNTATVKVVDESGNPITNATVEGTYTYFWTREVTFSNKGGGTYSHNPSGSSKYNYTVTVTCDGYETQTATVRGGNSVTVTLKSTAPNRTVSVEVVDALTGLAIENATVTAGTTTAQEQGNGSYTFSAKDGTYDLSVSADGYMTATESVTVNGDTTLRISLMPLPTVTVTVLDSQTKLPIENAAVTTGSTTAQEQGNGVYTFRADAGTHTLSVTADKYKSATASVTVTDTDAAVTVYLEITRYTATVHVLNASNNDAGIHGATVVYTSADGSVTGTAKPVSTLAADVGEYSFAAPEGEYTISVTAEGFTSGTGAVTLDGADATASVYLSQTDPDADYVTFEMFYYIGSVENTFPPNGYAAAGSPSGYGPSGNDVPFGFLTVDITKLKEMDNVRYNSGTSWSFVPLENNSVESSKAFWADVLACATEASREEIRATGLYDEFVCYCIKKQSGNDFHADGILAASPPVYVVELHKDGAYMGGCVTGEDGDFPTMAEVLDLLEGYLGHNIVWNTDENGTPVQNSRGNYTGTYVSEHYVYSVTVSRLNGTGSGAVQKADIIYAKQGAYYFLAQYEITTAVEKEYVEYTVIYGDGVAEEEVFSDEVYGVFEHEAGAVPPFSGNSDRPGYRFLGWKQEGGDDRVLSNENIASMTVTGDLHFTAVYQKALQVTFHTNNGQSDSEDIFRTYYSADVTIPQGGLALEEDNTVAAFYDIPTFSYETHNQYIFAGWYLADDTPMDWDQVYTEDTHIYAHWIQVGTVAHSEADQKQLPEELGGAYPGYELVGIQLRGEGADKDEHYGEAGSGLRFIAVLSQSVYDQINLLPGNESGAEYGFVMAKAATIPEGAELLFKGSNVNGENTNGNTYARNLKCSGVPDHFNGDAYRLYTGVVTYKSAAAQGDEVLQQAYSQCMVARAYIRYYDANGLLRTYHSNYTGSSQVGGGCSASYNMAMEMLTQS